MGETIRKIFEKEADAKGLGGPLKWLYVKKAEKDLEKYSKEHPISISDATGMSEQWSSGQDGPCLPGASLISTPGGFVQVKNLNSGDLVWTVNRLGQKVEELILLKSKRLSSKGHKMAHVVLEDGRKLIVSPGHPTIDNKELGSLEKGQVLDNSKVSSIKIMPYKEKYTYDILPSGGMGAYWANGILIGSTLSAQFKKTQEEKYSRLFV